MKAPQGESEVTRRIERGAGSAYRIDGRDVRAKDVSLLFADAATGAHSPALVSQGQGRLDHRRQADRAASAARRSGRHFRPACAAQGCRAEASSDRSQSHPAGGAAVRSGAAGRCAEAPGARCRALSSAVRQDPRRPRRGWSMRAGSRRTGRRRPRPQRRRTAERQVGTLQGAMAQCAAGAGASGERC